MLGNFVIIFDWIWKFQSKKSLTFLVYKQLDKKRAKQKRKIVEWGRLVVSGFISYSFENGSTTDAR